MLHRFLCVVYTFAISSALLGFTPSQSILVAVMLLGVATLGIPHGGLDHWTGRRWLRGSLGDAWWTLFFPAYLAVAVIVTAGWMFMPLLTALMFFVLSAWHFGLDEELPPGENRRFKHWTAIAIGGIVIWVPAVFRSHEMSSILATIIPNQMNLSATTIVTATGIIAIPMLLVACWVTAIGFASPESRPLALRTALLAIVCATTPILLSFGLYFCLWHSIRGLVNLHADSGLTPTKFVLSVIPLTVAAILMVLGGSWFWSQGNTVTAEATRSLFIGLSAMAVPHLILHGLSQTFADPFGQRGPQPRSLVAP